MNVFKNILYVSDGIAGDCPGLVQALRLTEMNGAKLRLAIVTPKLPKEFSTYQDTYETGSRTTLMEAFKDAAREAGMAAPPSVDDINVGSDVSGLTGTVISKMVLRGDHDLLIRESRRESEGAGYSAIEMELLRKCPSAVWLVRAKTMSAGKPKIAVAIDPQETESQAILLTQSLLQEPLSSMLDADLHIISSWSASFDDFRTRHFWGKVSEKSIRAFRERRESLHKSAMERTLKSAGLSMGPNVHQLEGSPDMTISKFVSDNGVDTVVIGTIGRVGIPGLLMGNTAEKVLRQLDCSLLALKPEGFVSTVML
jgi:nucleotide-binding universal stress UspA family protein